MITFTACHREREREIFEWLIPRERERWNIWAIKGWRDGSREVEKS